MTIQRKTGCLSLGPVIDWRGNRAPLAGRSRFKLLALMSLPLEELRSEHPPGKKSMALAVVATLALVISSISSAAHPPLIDPESTDCGSCHAKLTRGFKQVHPPAEEECGACHEAVDDDQGKRFKLTKPDPELCLGCHDEKEKAVKGTFSSAHPPVADSCLTCHSAHAANQSKLLSEPVPVLCLGCHDMVDLVKPHKGQVGKKTNCLRCHAPHGSPNPKMLNASNIHPPFKAGSCTACHLKPIMGRVRFRARSDKLCGACHKKISHPKVQPKSVHAAMKGNRRKAGCLSCHDPHLSPRPSLLLAKNDNICASCHQEIVEKAKAKTGHPPASEDCLNCHVPHTSQQPKLLIEPPADLCATCHDPGDEVLKKAHLGANLRKLNCLSCHTPHGSGQEHLLHRNVHGPVLFGCDNCHKGRYDQFLEDGKAALCLSCHEDVGDEMKKVKIEHGAMEAGECILCHNPHASNQRRLIKAPNGEECLFCHEDQVPEPGERSHGIIQLIGCEACHEPHGGDRPMFLRKTGNDLCRACHDPEIALDQEKEGMIRLLDQFDLPKALVKRMARVELNADGERGHPIPNHRVSGVPTKKELKTVDTTFTSELACLTCHDPHKSNALNLLRKQGNRIIGCATCHPK